MLITFIFHYWKLLILASATSARGAPVPRHRITECRGWKGPQEIIKPNTPAKAGTLSPYDMLLLTTFHKDKLVLSPCHKLLLKDVCALHLNQYVSFLFSFLHVYSFSWISSFCKLVVCFSLKKQTNKQTNQTSYITHALSVVFRENFKGTRPYRYAGMANR